MCGLGGLYELQMCTRTSSEDFSPLPSRAGDPCVFLPRGNQLTGPSSPKWYSETSPLGEYLAQIRDQVPCALSGGREVAVGSRVEGGLLCGMRCGIPQGEAPSEWMGWRWSLPSPSKWSHMLGG